MALAIVQSKAYGATSNNTNHSITLDSSITQGNLLIFILSSDNGVDTGPSGFTERANGANYAGWYVYTKTAGASESTTQSVVLLSSVNAVIHAIEVSGANTASPFNQSATNNPAANAQSSCATGTTGTTDTADELLIAVIAQHSDTASSGGLRTVSAWNNSFTSLLNTNSTVAAANNTSLNTATRIVSATGAYSSTATFSGGTTNFPAGFIFTIRAAADSRYPFGMRTSLNAVRRAGFH